MNMTAIRLGHLVRHRNHFLRPLHVQRSPHSQFRYPYAAAYSTTSQSSSSPQEGSSFNPKSSSSPQKGSSFMRKCFYLTTGLASTGLAVSYAADPDGMKQTVGQLYEDFDSRVRFFTEPSRDKLLPDQVPPYPGAPPTRTLVIDLDRTLVHSSYSRATGWRVAKRPGAEAFLAYMAQFYEIVVFTGNLNTYADPILDKMDPNFYVSHRLYRAETHYKRGTHIKDLSHLNRDLNRVIVIDHNEKQVSMQPENAILIPEWSGDANDTALLDLIPVLESVVRSDVGDVRDVVSVFKGKSVADGVAQWRRLAAEMESASKQGSLFGLSHGAESGAGFGGQSGQAEEESGSKGVVWGTLTGSGLFSGSGQTQRSGD